MNLYGIPEKIKSDKGGAFVSSEYKEICTSRKIESQFCLPRMHTGNGTVERAIQTMKILLLAIMEDRNNSTENVKRAINVMRFTIHTGLEKHHSNCTTVENRERN